ncbi:MAG: hypothetical protein B7Z30_05965, partial [Rhizobiales bacterium 12-68-15]
MYLLNGTPPCRMQDLSRAHAQACAAAHNRLASAPFDPCFRCSSRRGTGGAYAPSGRVSGAGGKPWQRAGSISAHPTPRSVSRPPPGRASRCWKAAPTRCRARSSIPAAARPMW